ncbi:MAG: hypothetical protein AAB367_00735 [Patescibacteria group bacterium]
MIKRIALVATLIVAVMVVVSSQASADDRDKDRIRRQFETSRAQGEFISGGTVACPEVTTFRLFLRLFHRTEDGDGKDRDLFRWKRKTRDCNGKLLVRDSGRTNQPRAVVINANVSKGIKVVLQGQEGQYIFELDPSTKAERGHSGGSDDPAGDKERHKQKTWWFWDQNPVTLVMPGPHGLMTLRGLGEFKIAQRNVIVYCIGGC